MCGYKKLFYPPLFVVVFGSWIWDEKKPGSGINILVSSTAYD
jgi:hypothetical protein